MIGKILTEDNKKLLNLIYSYGGYIRIYHLDFIQKGISHTAQYYKLNKLVEMKYLTTRRLKTNSKREPVTYQVTKPTCRLFSNPDSYYRKKHQEEYIYRALIKSYFCFENHDELGSVILADHEKRASKFRQGNFNEELFPKKYNKENSFVHFEEFVLDFTNKTDKKLMYDNKILYDDSMNTLVVMYIDQYYKDIKKQVYSLINKYIDLINSGGDYNINFLIIVDDENREELYKLSIDEFVNRYKYRDKISDKLTKSYLDYLVKYHEEDHKKVSMLKDNFINGLLKKELIDRVASSEFTGLTEQQKIILNQLELKRESYIIEKFKSIISTCGSIKDSYDLMDDFFMNLFIIEYHNFFKLSNDNIKKLDIKVYKIDKKIYE